MDEVQIEEADGIATVIINRPEVKNAITTPMWQELREIFRQLGYRDEIRCVVVTGAKADFCSGADVGARARAAEAVPVHPLQSMRHVGECCRALFELPKVTIARVDGVAAGAGLNMALACDFVLASDRSRFSEIFARRGLSVDFGGSFLLPRIVGMQRAKELVLLAGMYNAAEAAEIGLVNRVVPVAELDALVAEWAARAVAGPPRAIAVSKALLNKSFTSTLQDALDGEGIGQSLQFTTTDVGEAMAAFVDKRDPEFTGW
ncbi:MAG: enoyl-CoA hydratase/isomerase family protein [Acidimicrobiales bacterium]